MDQIETIDSGVLASHSVVSNNRFLNTIRIKLIDHRAQTIVNVVNYFFLTSGSTVGGLSHRLVMQRPEKCAQTKLDFNMFESN